MTNTKSMAAFFLVLVSAITLRTSDAAAQSLTLDGVLAKDTIDRFFVSS